MSKDYYLNLMMAAVEGEKMAVVGRVRDLCVRVDVVATFNCRPVPNGIALVPRATAISTTTMSIGIGPHSRDWRLHPDGIEGILN